MYKYDANSNLLTFGSKADVAVSARERLPAGLRRLVARHVPLDFEPTTAHGTRVRRVARVRTLVVLQSVRRLGAVWTNITAKKSKVYK